MRRETIFVLSMFVSALLLRLGFGLLRTTEDLLFYTALESTQYTRVGLQKELMFYPLKVFDSVEARIAALAVVTASLNTMAALRFLHRSGLQASSLILALVLINTFFAQIDMHLVRQQIAVYIFLIAVSARNFSFYTLVLLLLALAYHEAALLLFISWLVAWLIAGSNFKVIRDVLTITSVIAATLMFLDTGYSGVIFLIYAILGFIFIKKDTHGVSLGTINSICIILIFFFNMLIPFADVTIERLTGVFVSIALFRLLFDGQFQIKNRLLKLSGLFSTLSIYVVVTYA